MNNTLQLSAADYKAIEANDSRYLNSKGANLYRDGEYDLAAAYYHLAASMGNSDARLLLSLRSTYRAKLVTCTCLFQASS
ncbi:TPA: hypothetical protein ACGPB3_001049 [Streptococcus suis]